MFHSLFTQPASKVFLMHQHQQYSYGWLQKRILQLTGLFNSIALKAGDRLLLAISDEVEFSAVFLAALANGIAIIPLDPDTKAPRATALVNRTRIACIIGDEQTLQSWNLADREGQRVIVKTKRESGNSGHLSRFLKKKTIALSENNYYSLLESIEPAPAFPATPASDTLAYIIFTSGTTAASKGVCITHGNLFTHLATLQKVYSLTEESSLLNQLMLWHADGCIQGPVLAAFSGCVWHHPFRFSIDKVPALLDYCFARDISHIFVVPAMLNMILQFSEEAEEIFQYPAFTALISVSAHLEKTLWERFETIFRIPVNNVYGLTETVAGSLFCGPLAGTYRQFTVGKPVDCTFRIVDDQGQELPAGGTGELLLKGDHIMKKYWDDESITISAFRDGWFLTGDLASMDADGFVTILGRKKNLIISGGFNIQPEEVTESVLTHPAVSEACALGLHDPVFGEKLVAAVVLRPGHTATSPEIADHCRLQLEEKKIPQRIYILDQLPKGASGKVQLPVLIENLQKLNSDTADDVTDLYQDILTIASETFQIPVSRISLTDTSQTLSGWDSLAHLSFVTELESHFGIRFNTAEIMTLNSIKRATFLIKEKYAKRVI